MTDESYPGEAMTVLRGTVVSDAMTNHAVREGSDVSIVWYRSTPQAECEGPDFGCTIAGGAANPEDADCLLACELRHLDDTCEPDGLAALETCAAECGGTAEIHTSLDAYICSNVAIGERVSVSGEFPARFELEIFDPPPASARMQSQGQGPGVAAGFVVLTEPPFTEQLSQGVEAELIPAHARGVVEDHMLIYAYERVPAESSWGRFLGGSLEPGYHIIELTTPDCVREVLAGTWKGGTCIYEKTRAPSPEGLATQLQLRQGPADRLLWPFD